MKGHLLNADQVLPVFHQMSFMPQCAGSGVRTLSADIEDGKKTTQPILPLN